MQTFKSYLNEEQELLTEADTSKATNAEMAICVAYNMIFHDNGMGYTYSADSMNDAEEAHYVNAIERAGVEGKETKFEPLMGVGKKVAEYEKAKEWGKDNTGANGESGGSILVHAGSGSTEATNYTTGSDNTSKADIRGNRLYQISLKKGGAQLMSAKSGEAEGIFESALKHYGKGVDNQLFQDALKVLSEDMKGSAKTGKEALITVGASKKEFVDWYATASKRATGKTYTSRLLKDSNIPTNIKISQRQLEIHLRAELKMLNIPTSKGAAKAHKKLHRGIPRLFEYKGSGGLSPNDLAKLAEFEQEFAADTKWKIGTGKRTKEDIVISQTHLTKQNISSADIVDDETIKNQIVDVIHTSATSIEWKDTLEKAFKSDTEFSKWLVYEGASGFFKFTGKSQAGSWSKYSSGRKKSVANRMMVFENSGVTTHEDMVDYAQAHPELVTNLDISYKASGASRYIKLGVPSVVKDTITNSYESELPMLQEELARLDAQYMLNEGVFSMFASAKQKLIAFKDKIKNIVVNFWESVIKKFIDKLGEWLKEGADIFMENLGFKGEVTFGTV